MSKLDMRMVHQASNLPLEEAVDSKVDQALSHWIVRINQLKDQNLLIFRNWTLHQTQKTTSPETE